MHSRPQFDAITRRREASGARALLASAVAAAAVLVAMTTNVVAQSPGPYNQLIYNQVQYNDSAAVQPPRLVQPQTLTPVRSYAPTRYPTTGAPIVQPEYLTPTTQSPGSNAPVAVAKSPSVPQPKVPPVASPPATTPLAAPGKPTEASPPIAHQQLNEGTKPERSGFWRFVLGPDAETMSTQSAPAAPRREHYAAAPTQADVSSPSLWNQFLGRSAPSAPTQVERSVSTRTETSAPTTTSSANPLQLASAEESDGWWPYPRPTLHDIEQSKNPATSATITVSGGLPSADMPSNTNAALPSHAGQPYPTTQYPTAPSTPPGVPPVPTVPGMTHGEMSTVATGLLQPFKMTNDAPVASMPSGENIRRTASNNGIEHADAQTANSLLQPFYATNEVPHGRQGGKAAPASNSSAPPSQPTSITDALMSSPLGRQLSMQSDEDFRTSGLASIDAEAKADQPWDGTVTVTWPMMANPFDVTNEVSSPAAVPSSVSQVAFMQDELPEPSTNTRSPDDLGAADDDDEDAEAKGADGDKDKKDTLVGAETLGNAPEDNTLAFLRTQTVLLAPGKHQFDIGIEYTITENDFPILLTDGGGNVVGVDNVEFKGRELAIPMELRYGLLPRLQGFLQVPVGWSNVQAAIDNYDEYENDGGIGDIGFGLTAQLRDAYKDCPYLIGTLAGLAPTGGDPFGVVGQITPNAPSLGNGFWAISGNLLWVQTRYDPVVLFYGLGARYQFEHEYFGIEFQPGTEFNYTLGTGFAVNERVTLSTQFFGAYIEELKANGDRVEGTIQEPLNLRVAATLAKPCNRLVEPFVTFGLTDDAISSNVGVTWTY